MDEQHPVGVVVVDDLRRSRVTVFFRLLLVIPHAIWVTLWSIVVVPAAILAWLIALVLGRVPAGLHRFFCAYIRYTSHVTAYVTLTANPFPGFSGAEGSYPIDISLPRVPRPQGRWRTLFRLFLAIPAMLLGGAVGGGGLMAAGLFARGLSLNGTAAFLGWFSSLVRGRMPSGFRDAGAYAVGYRAQILSYALFVTDRYPISDPAVVLAGLERPPVHPVHLAGDDDLRRSRVTVLFRLPLLIPHLVWLYLWTVVAELTAFLQWFVTLFRGRPAAPLHRFLSRWARYTLHVAAFGTLAANPFPGFTGRPEHYPLDLVLPGPVRQNRWKTGFRALLVLPAAMVNGALGGVLVVDAVLVWFAALATGKTPAGLRSLSAYCLRYIAQTNAFLFLLTDVYPHSSPLEGSAPAPAAEPPAEPVAAPAT